MNKLLILLLFPFFVTASEPPLRVGMELSYPPFEMICGNGDPCGISVDIIQSFGRFVNRDIVIDNIPFIGLIPSLKNEKIDLIISSLTITDERKNAIDFSDPYAVTGLSLLINIDSKVNDITDANHEGVRIVVKSGTSGELYAAKHLREAKLRVLDKEAICVLEVIQGKADAFIYDQLSVYTNWKKNRETTRVNLEPFQKEYWAIGARKGNTELIHLINEFLKKFRSEGGFEKLADKYLPEQKKAFNEMGVPFVF